MSKIAEMADAVIATVKKYVAEAIAPLAKRIDEVQKSIPAPVEIDLAQVAKDAAALVPAPDLTGSAIELRGVLEKQYAEFMAGARKEVDALTQGIAEMAVDAHKAIESLRQPEDGKPGKDATPVDTGVVVAEVLKQIRPPEDGKSVTLEDVQPMIESAVAKALLDFERRAQDVLIKAISSIPKPKDGNDGLGFDDMTLEPQGDRGFELKFSRGEQVKSFPFTLPVVLDRGVFKEGSVYEKGDGVTWGGSFFIAQKDNAEGKPGESDAWRLAVKRGRDGKNFEPREQRSESVKLT